MIAPSTIRKNVEVICLRGLTHYRNIDNAMATCRHNRLTYQLSIATNVRQRPVFMADFPQVHGKRPNLIRQTLARGMPVAASRSGPPQQPHPYTPNHRTRSPFNFCKSASRVYIMCPAS